MKIITTFICETCFHEHEDKNIIKKCTICKEIDVCSVIGCGNDCQFCKKPVCDDHCKVNNDDNIICDRCIKLRSQ